MIRQPAGRAEFTSKYRGHTGASRERRGTGFVAAGRKVAISERKLFGGTCVNTGCTPTKTLAASAYTAHVARRAANYGVRIEGSVNVDMKAVKAQKDAVVAVFRNGVEQSLKTFQGCTVYEGHGRFVAERPERCLQTGKRCFTNRGGFFGSAASHAVRSQRHKAVV